MKKIIKWLLVVLLIFPLCSCKENQLNEFGITYKLEDELKRAYYEQCGYSNFIKEDNIPFEAVEFTYYFGEYDGFHTFICFIAPYSFACLPETEPYCVRCEPIYIYKNKKLYPVYYAIENGIINKEEAFDEMFTDEKIEHIYSLSYKISMNYSLSTYYCDYLGIDTKTDKSPLYNYSFDYINMYRNNKVFHLYTALLKEKGKTYLPIEEKETIADIEFYYYDSATIKVLGTVYSLDEQGKMKYESVYFSLQEAYDLGYISKENLQEIKDIAIENEYIKDK